MEQFIHLTQPNSLSKKARPPLCLSKINRRIVDVLCRTAEVVYKLCEALLTTILTVAIRAEEVEVEIACRPEVERSLA
jgi:hypothetical protein